MLTVRRLFDILPLGNAKDLKMKHIELKTVAEIGNFVREERKRQNVTQLQLAGLAGTGIRFVSDLENGKGTIQVQNQWGQALEKNYNFSR